MRGCLQHDENDCGLACILTICKFLKISVDEKLLRKNTVLGTDGLSLYGITEVLRSIGIEALAIEATAGELPSLLSEEKKPILIILNEEHAYHYAVLYKTNSHKLFLWDPDKGKRMITKEAFSLIWSGYAVILTKVPQPSKVKSSQRSASVCLTALFQQRKLLALLVLFSVILMAGSLFTTFLYKNIIDQIELGLFVFMPQLKAFFIMMGICYVLMSILFIVKGKLTAYVKKELETTLQDRFVESLLNISIQKKEDFTSGGILDRYYRLPAATDTMIVVFSSVILESISLISGTVILLHINAVMFCMILLIAAAYIISFLLSRRKLFKLSKTIMDRESRLITHMKETVENLISLKGFENDSYTDKLKNEVRFVKKQEYLLNSLSITLDEALGAVEHLVMLLVLAYGVHSVLSDTLSLGTLLAFESFAGFFLTPVKNLLGVLPSLQETILTFHRIEDLFACNDGKAKEITKRSHTIPGSLCADDLEIAYGYDAPVLKNISFFIKSGEKIFLMGSSGCGKTTLAKALAGLHPYNQGKITWDNNKTSAIADLSRQVLYVPQEPGLFSGSIRENIFMWENEHDPVFFDEVVDAMDIRQMLHAKGMNLDSYLSESGTNLSGGEKQRIVLARAMMHSASLYILDEVVCHLGLESQRKIITYIKNRFREQTYIFITHNAKLLNDNDTVLFIDSTGKLHKNKHLQLLENNLEYKQLINGK